MNNPRRLGLVSLAIVTACFLPACGSGPPVAPPGPPLIPALPTPPAHDLYLTAVGDVLLDRGPGDVIQAYGPDCILQAVAGQLRGADITFCNLECPLSTVGPHMPSTMIFRADPATVSVLTDGGFDIVSVANNHTLDAGAAALVETLDHLDAAGIKYVGSARDPAHGSDPTFIQVQGLRVGFLAYTDLSFTHVSYSRVDADLTQLRAQIAAARGQCDLLLVSYHWGDQDVDVPNTRQVQVGHASIDAGADAVLGHHPHVLQGVEFYRGCPILYSMGDFVFDPTTTDRGESAVFELFYRRGAGWTLRLTPVTIPWVRMGPEYALGAPGAAILTRLQGLSAGLGTTLQIQDGFGYVSAPTALSNALPRDPRM